MTLHKLGMLALTTSLLAAGCGFELGDSTNGEEGRVEFSYQRSCFFGCAIEQPLLVGSVESISVSDEGDGAGVTATSSSPAVATFVRQRMCFCEQSTESSGAGVVVDEDATCGDGWTKRCDNSFDVETFEVGETYLELRDGDGELIDRVLVTVREAASARFEATLDDELGSTKGRELEMAVGQRLSLDATLFDADGQQLLAVDGVRWRIEDESVMSLNGWFEPSHTDFVAGDNVSIEANAPGRATVTLEVPGLTDTVEVRVVE